MGKVVKLIASVVTFVAVTAITRDPRLGFAAAAAVNAGVSVVGALINPPKRRMDEQEGVKQPIYNAADTRKIIYGKQRVAGTEVFIEEYDGNGRDDVPNDTLVLARVVADHPVTSFGRFWIGNEEVIFASNKDQHTANSGNATTGQYKNKLYLRVQDGKNNSYDGRLTVASPSWTTAHVGKGIAYFSLKATYDQEVFPYAANQFRDCYIEVEGKPVYDPRKDSTQHGGSGSHRIDDESTWEYSTNPALCIYDYLRDDRLGNPVPDVEINRDSIIEAANICDQEVAVDGGGTISRYTLNGMVDSAYNKFDNVRTMLTSMAGRIMWLGGEIHIFAGSERTSSSSVKLDEDVILSAQYDPLPPADSRYNEVRGTFISPDDNFQSQDYPPIIIGSEQALEGERAQSLNLPFTHDHRIAQRLAKIALLSSRQPLLTIEALPGAAQFAPMDVVSISWANFGLVGEDFRILSQTVNGGSGDRPATVTMTLMREEASVYAWSTADEKVRGTKPKLTTADPNLRPAPTGVQVLSETLSSLNGTKQTSLRISWDAPLSTVMATYAEYRVQGTSLWVAAGSSPKGDTDIRLLLPPAQSYEVRVRHQYVGGRYSAYFQPGSKATEAIFNGPTVHLSATPPTAAGLFENSIWINEDTSEFFVLKSDGNWLAAGTKSPTYFQETQPSGIRNALWFQPSTNTLYRHSGATWNAIGNNITDTSDLSDGAGLGNTAIWTGVTGRSRIGYAINESASGSTDDKMIRFFGFDSTGQYPDRSAKATVITPAGAEYTWGGTANSQTAYSGNGSNGVYHLILDISGGTRFVHTGTHSRKVGVCRNLGGSTLEYFRANVGWVSLSHDSNMIVIGFCERRAGKFVHAGFFEPTSIEDAPTIYSFVGIDNPNQLPIESIAGVYTMEPSAPCTGHDNGSSARISIASSTVHFGDSTVSYNSGTVTGLAFNTNYWVYAVDDNFVGGSVTYQATTIRTGLPARAVYFGQCKTPANGAVPTASWQGGYAGLGGARDLDFLEPT